jgi:tRNA 2-selenouridine synthase
MSQSVTVDFWLEKLATLPIIDVRSPGEFARGHIPEATNIPLFQDDERALIGTIYTRESAEKAIKLGYDLVQPRLDSFLRNSLMVAPDLEVMVYCARGGMRSNSFADHLAGKGFSKVYTLDGGYKAFRNFALRFFEKSFSINVLGGYTGSGKTSVLQVLAGKGFQTIDLEKLARHKGSAFGGIGQPDQPTTEHFENILFNTLRTLDPGKPIWVEDESNAIGRVNIPKPFYEQMSGSPLCFLSIPLCERARYLAEEYGRLDKDSLAISIEKIGKRLGHESMNLALQELKNGQLTHVAELLLHFYDKYYLKSMMKRDRSLVREIHFQTVNPEKIAEMLSRLQLQRN